MKKRNLIIIISIYISLIFLPKIALAQIYQATIEKSTQLLEDVMQMPDKAIPLDLLKNCYAIAIFPSTKKAGFIIGGRFGRGIMVARNKDTWTGPCFFTIAGLSYGFQAGVQAADFIFIIKNERGLDSLLSGKIALGADAAVSAGPLGRNAEISADLMLKTGIFSYSRSRGLFAGVSLKGSTLNVDEKLNFDYYGKDYTSNDILIEKNIISTEKSYLLIKTLNKYIK